MRSRFFLGLVFLLTLSCSKKQNTTTSLLDFVPKNASIVIKINNLDGLKSDLNNNDFMTQSESTGMYQEILKKIKHLDLVKTRSESLLAFSVLDNNHYEFTFITPDSTFTTVLDSVQDIKKESLYIESRSVDKYEIDGDSLFAMHFKGLHTLSSSKAILENLMKYPDTPKNREGLSKLYEVSNTTKNASIFIDLKNSDPLMDHLTKKNAGVRLSDYSDWALLDINADQNHLHLNGISVVADTTPKFLNLFKDTHPLADRTSSYAPSSTDAVISYTFDDYTIFSNNRHLYLKLDSPKDSLLNTVEEIGVILKGEEKAIFLNTYGSERLSQYLSDIKKSEYEYQGNQILQLNAPDFLVSHLNPLVNNFSANFCTLFENAFVFGESQAMIQDIILNYKNGVTFDKTDEYASAKDALADESTILYISNPNGIQQITKEGFSKESISDIQKATSGKNTFAAQVVTDKGFFHTNFAVQQTARKSKIANVSPLFTFTLDADLATAPQFVTNHRTHKKEIVVQDQEYNLYLISTNGKLLWKKQLEGPIQGKIHQVDIYKNRKLQLAFTTSNQFLVLDRNGMEVAPFNKKFEGGNLNGLAVFDYEKNKNYRFVVTQGDKIFMYNNTGNIVQGFKYTKAESAIIAPPKHFRIANKDYLAFMLDNGSLKIMNRVGSVRTKVDNPIDFSRNNVQLYKNKFVLTDKKGVLYQIGGNGKLNTTNLRLNEDHGIDATSNTFVYMNDNVLSIKGKKVELDFGVYSKPEIFYIYDKIYVGVTDIQNQKVYLYDSQAKPISGFPVFGTSPIALTDMENDRKLEVVAKDQGNSIIVYQMN
ncbi:ribonuclease HII [Maribacter polysaccharolyticus]|uniref:ribonuclease HII n=1 Tax=Maribacter polysaccharolyticus TaxID=3020831 RepID=UPI00237FBD8B|nr:ribonuclease HII [Maribacter polysaccharolyticus]MDE3742733.1 ribonuclease HII [Maribacter polysaccharolyticus]